jgi:hypothetical protein
LRNEDVIAHFVAVDKNLGREGLYVNEAEPPRLLSTVVGDLVESWDITREQTTVRVRIQPGRHGLDPITQIRDLSIALEAQEGESVERVEDIAPVRAYTYQEWPALVRMSGVFDWGATFENPSLTQLIGSPEGARRMVPVLRCSM